MVGRTRKSRRGGVDLRHGVAVALAAVTILVSSCGVIDGDGDLQTVKIGADLDLSGNGSDRGLVHEEALRLRVEQVNQQGLLESWRLELEILDNRSDPDVSAENVAELAADPDVAAIVTGGCDACALRAVDIVTEARIPTISLTAASEVVEPVEERRYLFQLAATAGDNVRVLSRELRRVGAETVGLVATDDAYGEEVGQRMAAAAGDDGVDVVVTRSVAPDEEEFESVAAELATYQAESAIDQSFSAEPPDEPGTDAVVVLAPERVAGRLAVALDAAEYDGQVLLGASAAGELFLGGAEGAALDGARMVFTETMVIDSVVASSPAKAARKTWFNDYTSRVGTYHAHSSFGADAVQVIVEAINRFDSADRGQIRDALENTQIDGLSGPIRIRVETHTGLKQQALVPLVAQGDRWRLATN